MFQPSVALENHDFEKVMGWKCHLVVLPNVEKVPNEAGLPFELAELDGMGVGDVIISITSA